jgi:L-iditol 2-dehydrogenase
MVMGHELTGIVRERGPGEKGVRPGDRVAINPLLYCGGCLDCQAGHEQLCRNRKTIGVNTGLLGGFAEFVVAPARNAILLTEEISFAEGSMAEPLAVGLRAASVAGPEPGRPIAVLGGGTIGLCTLLACLERGAGPVFVTDIAPHKLDMIARLGGKPIDSRNLDFTALSHEATGGRGFERMIDAVAVSGTIRQALPALAPGGTLVLVGLATPTVEVGLYDLVPQERVIKSAYAYTAAEYKHAVEMLNTRRVDVRPLLEGSCSLAEAPAMFESMANGAVDAVKVVVKVSPND